MLVCVFTITYLLFRVAISSMNKRQFEVALSTIEVEYMEATHGSKEEIWLQLLCLGIGFVHQDIWIYCDNHISMFLAKTPACHSIKGWNLTTSTSGNTTRSRA